MNALNLIKQRFPGMSSAEKRIADVILRDPKAATGMTVNFLAAAAGVSAGTVVNFANSLGLGGFTALKINLAQNLEGFTGFSFDGVEATDSPKTALHKMAENACASFRDTLTMIDEKALAAAARLLMEAKKIELYGAANSALVAEDAYQHLMRIGLPVYAVTDPLVSRISASHLGPGCLAVGISHWGRSRSTIEAMRTAKSRGAATLCITSYPDSPLHRLSDAGLVIVSSEVGQRREAWVSRLTHLLVLDGLCAYIGAQRGVSSIEMMDEASLLIGSQQEGSGL